MLAVVVYNIRGCRAATISKTPQPPRSSCCCCSQCCCIMHPRADPGRHAEPALPLESNGPPGRPAGVGASVLLLAASACRVGPFQPVRRPKSVGVGRVKCGSECLPGLRAWRERWVKGSGASDALLACLRRSPLSPSMHGTQQPNPCMAGGVRHGRDAIVGVFGSGLQQRGATRSFLWRVGKTRGFRGPEASGAGRKHVGMGLEERGEGGRKGSLNESEVQDRAVNQVPVSLAHTNSVFNQSKLLLRMGRRPDRRLFSSVVWSGSGSGSGSICVCALIWGQTRSRVQSLVSTFEKKKIQTSRTVSTAECRPYQG